MAAKTILSELEITPKVSIFTVINRSENNVKSSRHQSRVAGAHQGRTSLPANAFTVRKWTPTLHHHRHQSSLGHLKLRRYLNVIRFIVMELVESSQEDMLKRCLKETRTVLANEEVGVEFWMELALSCPSSEEVAKAAARGAKMVDQNMQGDSWLVTTLREIARATFSLRYKQPRELHVQLPRKVASPNSLGPLMAAVAMWHKGDFILEMEHSFYEFKPCDDMLTRLSSSECQLVRFMGSVSSSTAQSALAAAVSRASGYSELRISISEARSHELDALRGTDHRLILRTALGPGPVDRRHRPLPDGGTDHPVLTVVCCQGVLVAEVVGLIEDLAAEDKKYHSLFLQSWPGTDALLDQLITALAAAGVRTTITSSGAPRWTSTETDGASCQACGESSHQQEGGRCVCLMLPVHWTVTIESEMATVISLLPLHPLPQLAVMLPRAEAPPQALSPLLEALGKWHTGRLSLELWPSFWDFTSVDDCLTGPSSDCCQITGFTGSISSSAAQVALTAGATRSGEYVELRIAIPDLRTHELAPLQNTDHRLWIRTKLSKEGGVRRPRPLPRGRLLPELTVVCTQTARAEDVVTLIEDLVPEDMRYRRLYLQSWPGTDASLHQLVMALAADGVRTTLIKSDVPRWMPLDIEKDGCAACGEFSHQQGEGRCVELELPVNWMVSSEQEMVTVTSLLPHHQLPRLAVFLPRAIDPPPALAPLMRAVAQCHTGRFSMLLWQSYWQFVAVDHFLAGLSFARCQLIGFAGCINDSATQRALTASLCRTGEVLNAGEQVLVCIAISDARTHELAALQGTHHSLKIRTKLLPSAASRPSRRCPRPLPNSWPLPELTVVCSPTDGVVDVAGLIEDLVPENATIGRHESANRHRCRYRRLYLQSWPGTDASLDQLIKSLAAVGVRTAWISSEAPSWSAARYRFDNTCAACGESTHRPREERCVELKIPW